MVYHGSKEKFGKFDYNKVGKNGTSEGKGFYFTDKKAIAKGYGEGGYLYTVQFSGKKRLSSAKKIITKNQLAKYLLHLHGATDYLTNWGDISYDGLDYLLNLAVEGEYECSDNDVEMISGICNASGDLEVALNLLYKLLGYDSIVIEDPEWGGEQKLYVALISDIIKIISVEKI